MRRPVRTGEGEWGGGGEGGEDPPLLPPPPARQLNVTALNATNFNINDWN